MKDSRYPQAVFKAVAPYCDDALNLPVADLATAVPHYERVLGFRVVSRSETPHRSAILARDGIRIGLAENGGDPTQEGCYFEVDSADAAHEEIAGAWPGTGAIEVQDVGGEPHRVFFHVAPDGLCYMFGERQG